MDGMNEWFVTVKIVYLSSDVHWSWIHLSFVELKNGLSFIRLEIWWENQGTPKGLKKELPCTQIVECIYKVPLPVWQ